MALKMLHPVNHAPITDLADDLCLIVISHKLCVSDDGVTLISLTVLFLMPDPIDSACLFYLNTASSDANSNQTMMLENQTGPDGYLLS